jgi:hypothetical protein
VRQEVLSAPSAAALTQLSIDEITELVSAEVTAAAPLAEERTELEEFAASGVLGVA